MCRRQRAGLRQHAASAQAGIDKTAASVLAVALESVASVRARWGRELLGVDRAFTLLFTVEYVLRLVSVQRPGAYARSFFGIVDLLAVVPTYLSLVFTGAHSLLVIRTLRLLRVFRVFKLTRYVVEGNTLRRALRASRPKIVVFLWAVLSIVVIIGAMMYLIEGKENGFTSIPTSIYWAVVTLTTVGYGDIAPRTVSGQILATLLMVIGYAIIVPVVVEAGRISVAPRG